MTTESTTTGAASSGSSSDTSGGSTGEPVPACDPAFATELAAGEVVWTFEAPEVRSGAYGTAVAVAADGRVFAVGTLEGSSTQDNGDGWLHALAVDGTPIWEARYGGKAGFDDWFTDVAITPAGDLVIVGTETLINGGVASSSEQVAIAIGYDAAGNERWIFTIGPLDEREIKDAAPAVTADDDRVLVGATSTQGDYRTLLSFAELDHEGQLLQRWDHADPSLDQMELADVRFDAQGGALAVGGSWTSDAIWLGQLGTDLSDVIGFVVHEQDSLSPVAVEPLADGALVLARIDTQPTAPVARRPFLVRYDSTGAVLWSETLVWDGIESVVPSSVTIDCAGRIVLLATRNDVQPWIVRLDADGNELDRFSDSVGEIGNRRGVATDAAGNVIVTGRGIEDTTGEAFVVRMLAGGNAE